MANTALIVGCGDIGLRTARRWRARGGSVIGLRRRAGAAPALQAEGIAPLLADLDGAPPALAQVDTVFWFAPPPPQGVQDTRLRRWLPVLRARRLVYISTSGVYGDCAGRWIDESAPLAPQTDRARRRADAEAVLFAERERLQVCILRVPGLYGPGRLPRERLERGLPVLHEHEAPPSNRIHADDLAEAAIAAAARGQAGAAYNVSDGHPTTMTDYFVRCARLLKLPEPPRVTLDQARRTFTPAMLSFVEEARRLVTRRLCEETGWAPRYPDLARGLPACLGASDFPVHSASKKEFQ